jgi:hypothetical protein
MSANNGTGIELGILMAEDARKIDPEGFPWPDKSLVIFAAKQGKVVGRLGMLDLPHLEGPWVHEAERGGTVLSRLESKAEEVLKHLGNNAAFAYQLHAQPEIGDYLRRLGFTLMPINIWTKVL